MSRKEICGSCLSRPQIQTLLSYYLAMNEDGIDIWVLSYITSPTGGGNFTTDIWAGEGKDLQ